ncbi:unnamed protein product [Rhodiola kirilowii]
MQVRRQLQDIRQGPNETMYDYLEKFNRLERSCCTLGLPEKLIIEYLIDGLRPLDKMLLDASAGGSMMNLSLSGIRNLITDVAENARFREETTRQEEISRTNNLAKAETSMNSMPEEMKQIKEMMIQILRRQPVQIKPCEFCSSTDHKTDACPTLIVEEPEEVNAVVGYQGYNNNNSNDRSGPNQYPTGQYQQKRPNQYQASSSNQQGPNKWLEDMMKELSSTVQQSLGTVQQLSGTVQQLSTTVHQNQAKNDGAIADLKKHMSQLATAMSALINEPGRLPSQTVQNPKENVNAVTLRSGKKLVIKPMEQDEDKSPRLPREEQIRPEALETLEQNTTDGNEDASEEERDVTDEEGNTFEDRRPDPVSASEKHKELPVPRTETPKISTTLPFPVPARVPKQHVMDEDMFELFSKVEINIPLLEAIKQIPRYAKFLKELCTNRRRSTRYDQELVSRNVSAVIQRKVPPKCGDPGTYTIPCTIGNIQIENCMLDLGALINVLPFSIYSCLRTGPLEHTGLTIQLADRSCKQPEGKIEDVLVQVGKLVFPADFYVLKMENGGPTDHAPILLGRPFLKTSKMKIDCGSGMLSMEVEGEVFSFDIFRAMKHPMEFDEVHTLDTLDDLVQEV